MTTPTKSKDEILDICSVDENGQGKSLSWDHCIKAMDEYAKQQCIAFGIFLNKGNITLWAEDSGGRWMKRGDAGNRIGVYTNDQVIELFLQSTQP